MCETKRSNDYLGFVKDNYMNKFFILCVVAATFFHFGCATHLSGPASTIQDANTAIVQKCKYLADVAGSSGWGNIAASTGIENAKNEAREKAAKLGATHIVWGTVQGGYSPFVSGQAYQCPR